MKKWMKLTGIGLLWIGLVIGMGQGGSIITGKIFSNKKEKSTNNQPRGKSRHEFSRYMGIVRWETEKKYKKVKNGKFWNIEEIDTGIKLFMTVEIIDNCYPDGLVQSDQVFGLEYTFRRDDSMISCLYLIDGNVPFLIEQTCHADFVLTKMSTGRYLFKFFLKQKEIQSIEAKVTTPFSKEC